MTIHPQTLKIKRESFGLTQEALAEISGVSPKQIGRLEKGETAHRCKMNTLTKLAKALKISEEALGSPPGKTVAELKSQIRKHGFRLPNPISGKTAFEFDVIEERYGFSMRDVIELAPLLFVLLAEKSLAERRRLVDDWYSEAEAALSIMPSHLAPTGNGALTRVDEACDLEKRSLSANDITGQTMDEGVENLFAKFLGDFGHHISDEIEQVIENVDATPDCGIEFQLFPDFLSKLTNGEYLAQVALTNGRANLRDVPSELRSDDKVDDRVAWIVERLPEEERLNHEAILSEFSKIRFDLPGNRVGEDDDVSKNEAGEEQSDA